MSWGLFVCFYIVYCGMYSEMGMYSASKSCCLLSAHVREQGIYTCCMGFVCITESNIFHYLSL